MTAPTIVIHHVHSLSPETLAALLDMARLLTGTPGATPAAPPGATDGGSSPAVPADPNVIFPDPRPAPPAPTPQGAPAVPFFLPPTPRRLMGCKTCGGMINTRERWWRDSETGELECGACVQARMSAQ